MKKIIIIIQLFLLSLILKAQEPPMGNMELAVFNNTGYNIEIQLYPVSAVFNGELIPKYTLLAYGRKEPYQSQYYYNTSYINGTSYKFDETQPPGQQYTLFIKFEVSHGGNGGWDENAHQNGMNELAFGEYGFGVYKLVIKHLTTPIKIDSCLIEFDYYPLENKPGDCYIYINNDNFSTSRMEVLLSI